MPSLVHLPAELRQRILGFALPDVHTICNCFSREVLSLLHINHRLRADTAELIRHWSPVHYLSNAGQLRSGALLHSYSVNDQLYTPPLQRICLDLFHDADIDDIRYTCHYLRSNQSHPEIIDTWTDAVPALPIDNISEVYLDITPAPYFRRMPYAHRVFAYPWLKAQRVRNFLEYHTVDVGGLILKIHAHYGDRIQVKLTGTLHVKGQSYIDALRRWTGVELEYVGFWITNHDARFAKIGTAVTQVVMRKGLRSQLTWVEDIKWSKEARWAYAKVADSGEEQCAINDLKELAEFKMDGKKDKIKFAPARPERRAFQHRVASDIGGLKTESEGEEGERFVVVRKVIEEAG